MAEVNTELDKWEEIYKNVLEIEPDSEFELKPEDKNKSSQTTKMDVKKRKNSGKEKSENKQKMKKQKETAKDRLLKMNSFYANNNYGIWIQCTKCNKWRKALEYEEEHEVPHNWCCSMNLSGIGSCDEPENVEREEFSPVNFIPGTIVWAKFTGYPWWPGMIEDDPDIEEYYWPEKNGKYFYHVTFLDDKVSRAWVSSSFVRSFLDPPKRTLKYLAASHSKLSALLAAAEIRARNAMNMPVQERLQHFSFANRYKGKWGSPLPSGDEMEEEKDLTQMLIEEVNNMEIDDFADADFRAKNDDDEENATETEKVVTLKEKVRANFTEVANKGKEHNSKNRKTNPLTETLKMKAHKLENFKEKINNKKNNEEELTSSTKIKHNKDIKIENEIKEESCKEKVSSRSSSSKFKPPIKRTENHACEKNQRNKNVNNKKIVSNANPHNPSLSIQEENLAKKEMSEKYLENQHRNRTPKKVARFAKETENSKSIEENVKGANDFKGNDTVKTLEKNLKNSLNKQPILKNKNHANNTIIQETFNAEKKKKGEKEINNRNVEENAKSGQEKRKKEENKKKGKKETNNYLKDDLDNSEIQGDVETCTKVRKSVVSPQKEINSNSIEENEKNVNNFRETVIVKALEKNLKRQPILENKSHASNTIVQEAFNAENKENKKKEINNRNVVGNAKSGQEKRKKEENKKKGKKEIKNYLKDDLDNSEIQGDVETCAKVRKSVPSPLKQFVFQKTNIKSALKSKSSAEHLSVSNTGHSELMDTTEFPTNLNTSNKEKKGNLRIDEVRKETEENGIIKASEECVSEKNSCNEDSNKFSLSIEMTSEETEEEDSDPFEAE